MEFTFDTVYDQKALTTMAKALRKTVRKKRSRRSHIFGWIIIALALLLNLPFGGEVFEPDASTIAVLLVALVLFLTLLFEDHINGFVARKRMMDSVGRSQCVFNEEGYHSTTDLGKSEWSYDNIALLAETAEYFVFIFDLSHAQLYDKRTITGGTADEFRKFICEKTGKDMAQVK